MAKFWEKFWKMFLGIGLAVLLSGAIYNYFPDVWHGMIETKFFTGALSSSSSLRAPTAVVGEAILTKESVSNFEIATSSFDELRTPRNDQVDELDDLAEQIDVLQRKINDLIESRKLKEKIAEKPEDKNDESDKEDNDKKEDKDIDQDQLAKDDSKKNEINYLQILISEAQISGQDDDKQEFVELYNPNEIAVNLTGWYLQRKTKTASDFSTYAPGDSFLNKIIFPKSYFLIARQGYFFASYADVLTDNPLTEDNILALKNPGRNVSDWLDFGLAGNPPNGKTIGRKEIIGDFEIQLATPRQQNIKYVAPEILPSSGGGGGGGGGSENVPNLKNILINEVQIAGQSVKDEFIELYNPNNQDVNLSEFALKKKTASGTESSLVSSGSFVGTIPALGYFLIAPQDNDDGSKNYIGEVAPDLRYSGKTYSVAENNTVLLYGKDGKLHDKVGFGTANDFENTATINPDSQKTIGRKWISETINSQDTDNNLNDFELQIPTPKAQNVTYYKDTTPPEVTFGLLSATQTSLSFPINFEITDLLGTVTPSGLASYVFRWNDSDPAVTENWHEDAPVQIDGHPMSIQLTKQSEAIPVTDGKTYYFQVKAKDVSENWSQFLPAEPAYTKIELPLPPPVVDKTPPTGTIKINDGAEYTNSKSVVLTLSAIDDLSEVIEMKIANYNSYHDWEPYVTTKDWTLSASGDGLKTVRAKFKDSAGNETAVGIPATIILDTISPVITLSGEAVINLYVDGAYEEYGVTVADANIDANSVVIGGDVIDTSVPATYKVTYDATDKAGNKAIQVVRTVIVNPKPE